MRGNSTPTRAQKGHLFGRYLNEMYIFEVLFQEERDAAEASTLAYFRPHCTDVEVQSKNAHVK